MISEEITVLENALLENAFLFIVNGFVFEGTSTVFDAYPASKFTDTIGATYNPLILESRITTVAFSAVATSVIVEAYCLALKVFKESFETERTFSAP